MLVLVSAAVDFGIIDGIIVDDGSDEAAVARGGAMRREIMRTVVQ